MKDFDSWNDYKKKLQRNERLPTFREREIWWCSIGINIGHEIDGKNQYFNRPVLILNKFNKRLFWGLPLSTKIKESPHYYSINFKGNEQSVMLTHLRLYDSKRITHKMGKLTPQQFSLLQQEVSDIVLKNKKPH